MYNCTHCAILCILLIIEHKGDVSPENCGTIVHFYL